MVILGYLLEDIPKEYQGLAFSIHKLTGLSILALMILRALWRVTNTKPVLNVRAWERIAERTVHFLLYVVAIAMPLVGWMGSVAGGKPPHLGTFNFELPIEKNKALAGLFFDMHNTLAICLIVLFAIHVLAALYHHFIKKDGVLRRMLPSRHV